MHIALYSPCWPPAGAANGIVSYVATVRDYFASQGHRVSVLSEGNLHLGDDEVVSLAPHMQQGGLNQVKRRISKRLDSWHGALPCVGRMLAAQIQAAHSIAPIDILEMEESFGWSDTVRRLSGIPVVTRLHGPHFLKPARPSTAKEKRADLQRCLKEGRAVRSSPALTAPTKAMMRVTCEHYQRQARQGDAVIPNPIRLAPETLRWNLDACDRNHILMIGRFDLWKGADVMLLAFDKVARTHPAAHLTLVGPKIGIETAPGELADFETFARDRMSPEGAERVTLTGTLPPHEIAQLRRKAFVTVLASRTENFPYALLEGLAAGCPMVSTDWPGSEEIIENGETGFLTPVGDADALAARLSWLLDNPEVAAQAGAKGREHCGRDFAVETVGDSLLECYEATLRNFQQ